MPKPAIRTLKVRGRRLFTKIIWEKDSGSKISAQMRVSDPNPTDTHDNPNVKRINRPFRSPLIFCLCVHVFHLILQKASISSAIILDVD